MTSQLFLNAGQHGLMLVFINVLLAQIGLPIPAMPTLIAAGAIGAAGGLPLLPLIAWSVLACCLADCAWYYVGQIYGIRVLRLLCRISLEPDSCVSETQSRFERWGINSLLIAKFIPGLATIAPPLAGAMRIGWFRFIALSTVSALLWVGSAVVVGLLFTSQIAALMKHFRDIGGVAGVLVAAILALYVVYKWWERARFYKSLRMARIEVTELYALLRAGANPIIVDVRSPTARVVDPRTIPGALAIPLDAVGKHIKDLPRGADIILYCACPSEASAARVARLLMNQGFEKVRPLHGGLDAWIAAGYAVDGAIEPQPPTGSAAR